MGKIEEIHRRRRRLTIGEETLEVFARTMPRVPRKCDCGCLNDQAYCPLCGNSMDLDDGRGPYVQAFLAA